MSIDKNKNTHLFQRIEEDENPQMKHFITYLWQKLEQSKYDEWHHCWNGETILHDGKIDANIASANINVW